MPIIVVLQGNSSSSQKIELRAEQSQNRPANESTLVGDLQAALDHCKINERHRYLLVAIALAKSAMGETPSRDEVVEYAKGKNSIKNENPWKKWFQVLEEAKLVRSEEPLHGQSPRVGLNFDFRWMVPDIEAFADELQECVLAWRPARRGILTAAVSALIEQQHDSEDEDCPINVSFLPTSMGEHFVGRSLLVENLAGLLHDKQTRIISLVGPGGVGKTTILNRLIGGPGASPMDDRAVFAWSFYSQGSQETHTTSTSFFIQALSHFKAPEPPPSGDEQKHCFLPPSWPEVRLYSLWMVLSHCSTIPIFNREGSETMQFARF